jgi:hypothetical protein
MTDEEALSTAQMLLAKDTTNPGPTWLQVIDLCLWVKDVSKRLPKPKRTRNEYMREYMRMRRQKGIR